MQNLIAISRRNAMYLRTDAGNRWSYIQYTYHDNYSTRGFYPWYYYVDINSPRPGFLYMNWLLLGIAFNYFGRNWETITTILIRTALTGCRGSFTIITLLLIMGSTITITLVRRCFGRCMDFAKIGARYPTWLILLELIKVTVCVLTTVLNKHLPNFFDT